MRKEYSDNVSPLDYYVKFMFFSNNTRESMEVYCQKSANSDDFFCVEQSDAPLGQHLIEFLSVSTARLPPLVAEMKQHLTFVQSHDFDHHLVPVHIQKISEIYRQICTIHPLWSGCLHAQELWRYMNDYSFFSIHPSQYLIETYDEVDRLINEEACLLAVNEFMQSDFKLLESYARCLKAFEQALVFCFEGVNGCTDLSPTLRAYLFRSFFDELFLSESRIELFVNLQESYVSPLGATFSRDEISCSTRDRLLSAGMNDMIYEDVIGGVNQAFRLENLVSMVKDKKIELTNTIIIHDLSDIYSLCSYIFSSMLASNVHIRKCKRCGKYFIPINRVDEQYCYRKNESGKMCRELNYTEKINNDDYLTVYRTAYKTHNARKQRNRNNRINAEAEFAAWSVYAKDLMEKAKAGDITFEEYCSLIKK